MSKKISQDQIQQLRDKFSSDNHVKVVRNAMIKTYSNGLNLFRVYLGRKHNLKDFQLAHHLGTAYYYLCHHQLCQYL